MAEFAYVSYAPDGKPVKGSVEARDEMEAARMLAEQGRTIISIAKRETKTKKLFASTSQQQWSIDELALFWADMAMLLKAGLRVDQAIECVASNVTNKKRSGQIQTVLDKLRSGSDLSDALAATETLPLDALAIVKSAETDNRLAKVSADLAEQFKSRSEARSKLIDALIYPIILFCMTMAAVAGLALFLVPVIEPLFDSPDLDVPITISFLAGLRDILLSSSFALSIIALLLIGLLAGRSNRIQGLVKSGIERLPLIGRIIRERSDASYLDTLSALLHSGMPALNALALAANTVGNPLRQQKLKAAMERVEGGASFAAAFDEQAVFAHVTQQLITIGEESNALPTALEQAAEQLKLSSSRLSERAMTILVPAMTLGLGLFVGIVVVSVMGALMDINDAALR